MTSSKSPRFRPDLNKGGASPYRKARYLGRRMQAVIDHPNTATGGKSKAGIAAILATAAALVSSGAAVASVLYAQEQERTAQLQLEHERRTWREEQSSAAAASQRQQREYEDKFAARVDFVEQEASNFSYPGATSRYLIRNRNVSALQFVMLETFKLDGDTFRYAYSVSIGPCREELLEFASPIAKEMSKRGLQNGGFRVNERADMYIGDGQRFWKYENYMQPQRIQGSPPWDSSFQQVTETSIREGKRIGDCDTN
ncbi:hypothetical protein ABZ912_32150 [Nonomuraea angiospora]|uniref:hypothetical protein n=1 Tax=Nonomuraea angiospora TaxID=46172 RepID=UPI0033FDD5F0